MHQLFKKHYVKDLIPIELYLDEKGKKQVDNKKSRPWKNGQTYKRFPTNTVGLRTGAITANVVDVDTKDLDKLTEPFKSWVEDRLMFDDTLTIETKNGYHFYFTSPDKLIRTTAKQGAHKSPVPFIDFRGEGGMIFIHSDTDFANYEVLCDEQPTTNIADIIDMLPEYVEREVVDDKEVTFGNLDNPDDKERVRVGDKKPLEEILAMINSLNADIPRIPWMGLIASAYNLIDIDPERLREPLREWSAKAPNFSEKEYDKDFDECATGKFGTAYKGGTLVKFARDAGYEDKLQEDLMRAKYSKYMRIADECRTLEDVEKHFNTDDWKQGVVCTVSEQKAIKNNAKARLNDELRMRAKQTGEPRAPLVTLAELDVIIDVKQPKKKKAEKKKREVLPDKEAESLNFYIYDNKYCITDKSKIREEVNASALESTGNALGYNGDKFRASAMVKSMAIQGVKKETDYKIESRVQFTVKPSQNPSEYDYLHVLTNPLHGIQAPAPREDIIKDFFQDIWNGKAEDIIRLIGLTMRFKETKLNKIHIVAPSNTGKTTFLENIGFQTIHMKRLVQALGADKGIGKPIIDGLKASGFLLIDETNDPLTQDIKNIDNYISLDQFGQGGTQEIKLHFTCLTSTHKSAVRGMSDEMYNRLLLIELKKDESKFTIDKSTLFINDTEAYTDTLIQHTKWMLKDALLNPNYTKNDMHKLQAKYRLEMNSDVDEMLLEVSEKIITEFKALAKPDGDIIERNGEYYVKRKTDVHEAINNRLGEYTHIDHGKYGDALMSHFLSDERKSLKVNGKPVKYYKLKIQKYYANDEQELLDMFDDLDIEDL